MDISSKKLATLHMRRLGHGYEREISEDLNPF